MGAELKMFEWERKRWFPQTIRTKSFTDSGLCSCVGSRSRESCIGGYITRVSYLSVPNSSCSISIGHLNNDLFLKNVTQIYWTDFNILLIFNRQWDAVINNHFGGASSLESPPLIIHPWFCANFRSRWWHLDSVKI